MSKSKKKSYAVRDESKNSGRERILSITLDDCTTQTFTAGGPGGQAQNHNNTAVRIIHNASGAVGESREHRSQLQNKQAAFRRMTEHAKFKIWLNRQIWANGKTPEEKVREDMRPWNLKVEEYRDDEWHIIH